MSDILPNPDTPQLKVIDTYLKSLATFDFTVLKTLTTDDFLMITAPTSMNVPDKTKTEDLAFLEELKKLLNGQHLEVSRSPMISHKTLNRWCVSQYTIYDVVDGLGKTWVHVSLFIFRESTDLRLISRHSSRRS